MTSGPDRQRHALLTTAAGLAAVALVLLVAGLLLPRWGGTVALVGGWTLVGCGAGVLVAARLLAGSTWWH